MEHSFVPLAKEYLEGFRRVSRRLLREEQFDCILAPANSGSIMYVLLRGLCHRENIFIPPAIIVPVFTRYKFPDGKELPFDNALAAEAVRPQLRAIDAPTITNVLFLDDEIGNGTAFSACWDVFRAAAGERIARTCTCTILAEENGFRSEYPLVGVQTRLAPFAKRPSPDVSGIIYHAFPEDPMCEFREAFGDRDIKEIIATILGMPIKALAGRKPILRYELLRAAERHPLYGKWRKSFD